MMIKIVTRKFYTLSLWTKNLHQRFNSNQILENVKKALEREVIKLFNLFRYFVLQNFCCENLTLKAFNFLLGRKLKALCLRVIKADDIIYFVVWIFKFFCYLSDRLLSYVSCVSFLNRTLFASSLYFIGILKENMFVD